MKTNITAVGCLMVSSMCASIASAEINTMPITTINASAIVKNLPIKNEQKTTSDNGRVKHVWDISGAEPDISKFEIIGNNQADADTVAWQCAEYDAAGAQVKLSKSDSVCYRFLVSVITNVTLAPDKVAEVLAVSSAAIQPTNTVFTIGEISIETDGKFFAVRNIARK